MAARFRIDQVTPGAGTVDRSRTDLVPNQIISLVVPSPVLGATYSWEIVYKCGTTAVLSSSTGTSVSLGIANTIVSLCGFLIRLTETIGATATTRDRIACVRGSISGLRPIMFAERSNARSTRADRNADDSTDNEVHSNLSGVSGDTSQTWTGWADAMYELIKYVEEFGDSGESATPSGPANGDLGGTYPGPSVERIQGILVDISGLAEDDVLFYNGTNFAFGPGGGGGGGVTGPGSSTQGNIPLWGDSDGDSITDSTLVVTDLGGGVLELAGLSAIEIAEQAGIPANPASGAKFYFDSGELYLIKADGTSIQVTNGADLNASGADLSPFVVTDPAGESTFGGGQSFQMEAAATDHVAPASGAKIYVLNNATDVIDELTFLRTTGGPLRLTTPVGVRGAANYPVFTTGTDTVYDGWFAQFDLTGGNATALLDSNAPIGACCVVKINGPASGNTLTVDASGGTIDGTTTISLSADYESVRLTKTDGGVWSIG